MPQTTPKKGNTALVLAVVVIIALVLVAVGYYLSSNNGTAPDKTTNQPAGETNQTGQTTNQPAAPNEIFSYVGEVTGTSGDQITVLAKANANYVKTDTKLTVKADANTQIIRRTIPKVLPKEGGTNLFKQEAIKLSDISKGDQVTVVSATNVKDKTEFTASRIEVLLVK